MFFSMSFYMLYFFRHSRRNKYDFFGLCNNWLFMGFFLVLGHFLNRFKNFLFNLSRLGQSLKEAIPSSLIFEHFS